MKQVGSPFTSVKSNDAIDQNLDNASPLATALIKRRKDMANKRIQADPNQLLDAMGNPIPAQNDDT